MAQTIRAHFDGKVIVPDEPFDIPPDSPVAVHVGTHEPRPPRLSAEERRLAWADFFARPSTAPYLSNESLRREYIYDDEY